MRARARAVATLLAAAIASAPSCARPDDLTPRKQALLLLRVLVYDRNLKQRTVGAVRVAVAFRAGDQGSEEQRDQLVAAFQAVSAEVVAGGLPIEVIGIPYRDEADFAARLAQIGPACVYVSSSLEPLVKEIARATVHQRVLSMAGSKELIRAGLAIGIVNRGMRAGVVVNLPAARAEGADLDAALLGIAEVIP